MMLDKTFIPGNILTANELNDLVDGLNNVDVRIGEQFQCCCDEEIKPALLGHIANLSIHQEYSDIVAMVEKKISEALKNFNKGDDGEDDVIYATEDFARSLIKDWLLKSDFESKMSSYVLHTEFDPIIADLRRQIEDLGGNPGSGSDGDDNYIYALKSDLTALQTYVDATFIKERDLSRYGFVDADYVTEEIKKIPKNIVTYKSGNLSGYNTIPIGALQQNGVEDIVLYAPVYVGSSDGGNEGGGGTNPTPENVVVEHYVVLYSNKEYDRLWSSLHDTEGNPKGDWNFASGLLINPNSTVWSEDSSDLTGTIYFTTRVFYSDNRPTDWSTPALFVTTDSFVSNSYVQIYAKEENGTYPALNESEGSYNFKEKKLTGLNSKWKTSLSSFNIAKDKIYYTWRTFYSDDTVTTWHMPPIPLITSEQLKEEINAVYSKSNGVAIYKVSENKPSIPTYNSGQPVMFIDKSNFTVPGGVDGGWCRTIQEALDSYNNVNLSNKKYKIWVSYNNFILTFENGETGPMLRKTEYLDWTEPQEYIDINQILLNASDDAKQKADEALRKANDALNDAVNILNGDIGELDGKYNAIAGADGENIAAAISGIVTMYDWVLYTSQTDMELEIPIIGLGDKKITWGQGSFKTDTEPHNVDELLSKTGVRFINRWHVFPNNGAPLFYAYVAQSLAVINQVAEIGENLDTVKELINSKEFAVSVASKSLTDDSIKTSMLQMLNDNISLVVTLDKDDDGNPDKSAVISLKILNDISSTEISSDRIVLNGSVIAAAIASKELNINDTTYLKPNGQVLIAQGTDGASKFNTDGSGNIAGGLIEWGREEDVLDGGSSDNFALRVKGQIEAYSGHIGYDFDNPDAGWLIGNVHKDYTTIPALIGKDSNDNELQLTTNYLGQLNADGTYGWQLNSDGSAILGDRNRNHIELHDGNVTMTGKVCAESGYIGDEAGWNIGTVSDTPVIYSEYGPTQKVSRLVLSPQEIYSSYNDRIKWQLSRNGSGNLANGNISWDTNGNASFAGNVRATNGLFRGKVEATSGSFTGDVIAKTLKVQLKDSFMTIAIWDSSAYDTPKDSAGNTINIPDGAPVFIVKYDEHSYVVPIYSIDDVSTASFIIQLYYVLSSSSNPLLVEEVKLKQCIKTGNKDGQSFTKDLLYDGNSPFSGKIRTHEQLISSYSDIISDASVYVLIDNNTTTETILKGFCTYNNAEYDNNSKISTITNMYQNMNVTNKSVKYIFYDNYIRGTYDKTYIYFYV